MRDAGSRTTLRASDYLAVGEGHPVPGRMRLDRPDGLRLQLRDEALLKVEAVGDERLDCDREVRRVVRELTGPAVIGERRVRERRRQVGREAVRLQEHSSEHP